MEVSDELHALTALPPVPIGLEAGWAPEPVWTVCRREKSSVLGGDRTLTIHPLARRYTDSAIPTPI
jgi:hypothetical protein